MAFLRYSVPNLSHWLLGGLLALLVLIVVPLGWALVPPTEPMHVDPKSIVSQIRPDDLWQAGRTNVIREQCGSITFRRFFRGAVNGRPIDDFMLPASDSSRPDMLAPIVPGGSRPPGTYDDWWAYRPMPGFVGSYIVTVAASDCERSGYNGVFTLYVIPVDWSALRG
jgi:hypothetical protein